MADWFINIFKIFMLQSQFVNLLGRKEKEMCKISEEFMRYTKPFFCQFVLAELRLFICKIRDMGSFY